MAADREPLGAGTIIGETFRILIRRFGYVIVFAGIPALALGVLEYLSIPDHELSGPIGIFEERSASGPSNEAAITTASIIMRSVIVGLVAAAMAQLVYRLKTGQSIAFGELVPATALSFSRTYVVMLLLLIGASLTAGVIGFSGLYLSSILGITAWIVVILFYPVILAAWALFGLALPVSSIEGLWIGSFARSLQLTKAYRWPCLGIFVVVIIAVYLVLAAAEATMILTGPEFGSRTALAILSVATYVLMPASLTIAATLIYMRLREIREGMSADRMDEVFG